MSKTNAIEFDAELPKKVEEVLDRHDLWLRTDSPLSAATVLVLDAADILMTSAHTMFREQALTSETLQTIAKCRVMVSDAVKLAPFCETEPTPGHVSNRKDGVLRWEPEPPK